MIERFLNWLDADRAVKYALYRGVWQFVAGPITLIFIYLNFSPELQGYYYTFLSVIAVQAFLELGFNQVIIPFASHEWAHLDLDEDGHIVVHDPDAFSRLISLGQFVVKWYAVVCLLLIIVLSTGGYWFLSQRSNPDIAWEAPWFAFILLNAMNLWLLPFKNILHGCNQVETEYLYDLIRAVLHSLVVWSVMTLGGGLWTLAASSGVGLCVLGFMVFYRFRHFIKPFFAQTPTVRISWRLEILPMQWRVGITTVSGFFLLYLFTPVMFHYHGAVVAGQMGMTWQIINLLGGLTLPWMSTKAPRFGMLVSKRKYLELDDLFFRTSAVAMGTTVIGAVAALMVVYGLNYAFPLQAERLLTPLPIGLFLLATFFYHITMCQLMYMRAHKREPAMLLNSVVALINALLVWALGKTYGPIGAASAYLIVTSFILFPFTTAIWIRSRKIWQKSPEEPVSTGSVSS